MTKAIVEQQFILLIIIIHLYNFITASPGENDFPQGQRYLWGCCVKVFRQGDQHGKGDEWWAGIWGSEDLPTQKNATRYFSPNIAKSAENR